MRLIRLVRRVPCGVLLALQLLAILVYPFLADNSAERLIVNLIGIGFVAMAVYAVRSTPAMNWVSMMLGIPVLVLTLAEIALPNQALLGLTSLLQAAFYFYTAYALIRYMFADEEVTTDDVLATGATFTVVAWGFAYLFQALQVAWPGSFTAELRPEAQRTWVELLYVSVTTLTSTGLSDVVPVSPQGRAVVMIAQITGMMYLALVVARVTALMSRRATRRELDRRAGGDEGPDAEPT